MTASAGRGALRAASGGTLHRLARWTAVAALGSLAVTIPSGASAESPSPNNDPCLVVKVLDEHGDVASTRRFTADQISQDQSAATTTFHMRSSAGPTPDVVAPDALSLTVLVGEVGLTLPQVQYAEVIGPDGTPHDLSQRQLGGPAVNGFADGLSPAVWALSGALTTMNYGRPLIQGDPADVNSTDFVSVRSPQPMVVLLHTSGQILHPTITADRAQVRAGSPDTFRVTFSGDDLPLPPGVTYAWFITPAEQIGQGTPPWQHAWTRPGTYDVYLQVAAPDTSSGRSNSVRVVVCPKKGNTTTCTTPPSPGPPDPGGGHQGGQNPPTGPNGGHGHHQGGHVHGNANPQSPTHPGDATNPGSGPNTAPGAGHTSTAGGNPGSHSGHQHGGPKAGTPVSGQLLAASAAFVVPEQRPSVTAAAAPSTPTGPQWAWQWKWASVLLLPLLVGLGMAGESLQLRRRLARMGA